MKKIFISVLALSMTIGLVGCDFFEEMPGVQFDLKDTFSNRQKTEQFLNNIYSYAPDDNTGERFYTNYSDRYGGIWMAGSIEANWSWDWHNSHKWNLNQTSASSSYVTFWYDHYYQGINKASIFIQNVDSNPELTESEKVVWKAQARAMRAYYYWNIFRCYGPIVILGEEPVDTGAELSSLLRARNTVDECIKFIADEFDAAAKDLPARYTGANYGRIDRGACKAYKAKALLYAASPLYNGNTMYAKVVNNDGTNLFPQTEDRTKWEKARDAFKEFLDEFVPAYYDLHVVKTADGKTDFYESYRQITTGCYLDSKENIFVREVWHGELNYAITPGHRQTDVGSLRGGLGLGTSQEMVDMFFTDKGLRIVDDPDYQKVEYGINTVPSADMFGSEEDFNDPVVPTRNYFKKNSNLTLKQWAHREPRFYVCVTYNGSTWLNTETTAGALTTELYYNGNSGNQKMGHDAPYTGYGMRKCARSNHEEGRDNHYSGNMRLGEVYLSYAEALAECGDTKGAIEYVNKIRARAGVPEYGTGKDDNGFDRVDYVSRGYDVVNLVRRERLVELCFESARFFDVRRWKVADMAVGDDWIYPSYHKGGEGGDLHGLNYREDAPNFFKKVGFQTRYFQPRHYLMPIPDADVRRNPLMVQNYDWGVKEE